MRSRCPPAKKIAAGKMAASSRMPRATPNAGVGACRAILPSSPSSTNFASLMSLDPYEAHDECAKRA
jgi:hypothetical protein